MLTQRETENQSVNALYMKLRSWDFSRVKAYLHDKGSGNMDLDRIAEEYKRFIALSVAYSERLPISSAIDGFWHAHILFTKDYRRMCSSLGVGYIDHTPTTNKDERSALRGLYEANTLRLYKKHFGEPDPKFWPQGAQLCDMNGDCTDCEHSP